MFNIQDPWYNDSWSDKTFLCICKTSFYIRMDDMKAYSITE